MMSEASPWDEIAVPGLDYNVRLVAAKTPVPCFWGRDTSGSYLFIVELAGDHTAQFDQNRVASHGIEVDLREGKSAAIQQLVITLEQQVDRDLFEGLCQTLISALAVATDPASALAVAIAHIRRWKTFMSGRGGHRLSPDEIRGLFAELTYLSQLIIDLNSEKAAISAWLGPDRSHQDFIFGNVAVEIKSLSGAERNTVHISSEDQLESLSDALFLRVYRLSNLPDSPRAVSLNGIVSTILNSLKDADAVEDFERKLISYRYAPMPEYEEPLFVVSDIRTYRVVEGFPRLIRSALPDGVKKVGYEIELETLLPFECDNSATIGGPDGTDS